MSIWSHKISRRNPPSDVSRPSLTLSITLTTRSITGSETSGVIPVNHRYTPRQDRMPRSLFHDPPLKLGVPNTIGDFRTSAATKPTDVRDAHPVC
jgi:hypothetical protein